jgi:hypothetical protein
MLVVVLLASLAFGLTDALREPAPMASFDVEYVPDGAGNASNGAYLNVSHEGGTVADGSTVSVRDDAGNEVAWGDIWTGDATVAPGGYVHGRPVERRRAQVGLRGRPDLLRDCPARGRLERDSVGGHRPHGPDSHERGLLTAPNRHTLALAVEGANVQPVEQSDPEGVDYGWVMQTTFVVTILVGAPLVAALSTGVTLPTWEARISFAVRVGAVVWFLTAVAVFLYARRTEAGDGGSDPDEIPEAEESSELAE